MAKARRKSENAIADLSGPANEATVGTVARERVAQRAYEIYLARGGVDGQDLDDWLNAERELAVDRTEEGSSSRDDEL